MDPVTQGALGAAAAEAVVGHRLGRRTWVLGAMAGMAPDLDVFIRGDALTNILFHRHFTHSLAFAPVGALVCALPFIAFARWRASKGRESTSTPRLLFLCALVGWLTHAPLDACTSYGTMLYWPFSDTRVAWDVIAIVDPLYTVPLLVGVALMRRYGRKAVLAGLAVAHVYMALCGVQRGRAASVQAALAAERGHEPPRGKVLPYVATNVLWRSVYEHRGEVYVDLVVTPWFGGSTVLDGHTIPLATNVADLPPKWQNHARRDEAFELMHWFSEGWLGVMESPSGDPLLCDVRLSTHATQTLPIVCLTGSVPLRAAGPGDQGVPEDMLDAALRYDPGQRVVGEAAAASTED